MTLNTNCRHYSKIMNPTRIDQVVAKPPTVGLEKAPKAGSKASLRISKVCMALTPKLIVSQLHYLATSTQTRAHTNQLNPSGTHMCTHHRLLQPNLGHPTISPALARPKVAQKSNSSMLATGIASSRLASDALRDAMQCTPPHPTCEGGSRWEVERTAWH